MSTPHPLKSYVWYSSPESREAGQVSILAVGETILSVVAFWALAHWFDMGWLLFTSVILAFLVLLRSPQSITKGLKLFESYHVPKLVPSKVLLIIIFGSIICTSIPVLWLATEWLDQHFGWAFYWRVFASIYLTIFACSLTAITLASIINVDLGASIGSEISAALSGVSGFAASFPSSFFLRKEASISIARVTGQVFSKTFPLGIGLILGIFIRVAFIRFWATLTNVINGLSNIPENWTALAFKTDLFMSPELIPGLPNDDPMHFDSYIGRDLSTLRPSLRLYIVLSLITFYYPSIIYRYYLKSTAWIYFPLVWVTRVPKHARGNDGKLIWYKAQRRSLIAKMGFVLALITVIFFVWRYVDLVTVTNSLNLVSSSLAMPAHPLLMLAGFEFTKISWLYWLPPAAAACGVWVYLWTNVIHTHNDHYPQDAPKQWKIRTILWLNHLTSLLAYSWIAIGVFELAWVNYESCQFPPFIVYATDFLFGPAACALTG